MKILNICGGLWLLVCSMTVSAEQQPAQPIDVDLALVLVVDASESMDQREYMLVREGIATAFATPEIMRAIANGSIGKIAVAEVQFSTYAETTLYWQIVDADGVQALAAALSAIPRPEGNLIGRNTSVTAGIALAEQLLNEADWLIRPTRKVIDVLGDGANNTGEDINPAREFALSKHYIINGLPVVCPPMESVIMSDDPEDPPPNSCSDEPNLVFWYEDNVKTGRGAFIEVAEGFEDISRALRRKLIREIAWLD